VDARVTPDDAARTDAALRRLRELGSVLVVLSGGVDSALVLSFASEALGAAVRAFTAAGPAVLPVEVQTAREVADRLRVVHVVEATRELDREGYRANQGDRCFHCREELYSRARVAADAARVVHLVDGTQLDDLGEDRPGLRAAAAAGVVHVLVEAGFDKAAVRRVARTRGLAIWDKPAEPCLGSRLQVGTAVTPARLARVAALEAWLAAAGFHEVRVRTEAAAGGDHARVEVAVGEVPRLRDAAAALGAHAAAAGFVSVAVDPRGYRRGGAAPGGAA